MKTRYTRDDPLPRVSYRDWIDYNKHCDYERKGPGTDEVPENAKLVPVWVICGECHEDDVPDCQDCAGRGGMPAEMRKDWLTFFETVQLRCSP